MQEPLNQIHFKGKKNLSVAPNASVSKKISFKFLSLKVGEIHNLVNQQTETAIIILSGQIKFSVNNVIEILGERENVFAGKASALYLPAFSELEISAETYTELAITSTPSSRKDLLIKVVKPSDVRERLVGKDNWSRSVHDILGADFPADKLIIGETFNPPGNWSSSPPHKHDRENLPLESKFEEIYFYKLNPKQGFGIQRIYTEDRSLDLALTVEENDIVIIPKGYHPVVAAPGYELYYLWVLVGEHRNPQWAEDPAHSWIKENGS